MIRLRLTVDGRQPSLKPRRCLNGRVNSTSLAHRIKRNFSYENTADEAAPRLDHLNVLSADPIGFSMGAVVAMQCAIRHPESVRKVVGLSAVLRDDGSVKKARDGRPEITAEPTAPQAPPLMRVLFRRRLPANYWQYLAY